jgi:acetamidase/formamidase
VGRVKVHRIGDEHRHYKFDRALRPAVVVDAGDTVVLSCREATDGQFTPNAVSDHMRGVDQSRVHSLTGPVAVRGAEPGDTLVVEFLDFEHEGWAWTSVEPGFGVLHDEFGPDEWGVQIWRVDDRGRAVMKPGVSVPIEPFCGVAGVAPAEAGPHSTIPPRSVGGNMDFRHLCRGTTAYFPVEVAGGLLSLGDGHLGQGDGEVCGTAMEAPLTITIRVDVRKGEHRSHVGFETTRDSTAGVRDGGYYVTAATGPDTDELIRRSVSDMVALLVRQHPLTRMEAYMLCSAAADLKISVPVLGTGHVGMVTYHMPKAVFEGKPPA